MSLRSLIGSERVAKVPVRRRELPDPPKLETRRMVLRRLLASDLKDIFEYATDEAVARYTLWEAHKTLDETRTFIGFANAMPKRGEGMVWGVYHKADHKLIGTCGFGAYAPQHARAELGFALSKKYWRRGLMTEASNCILQYLFMTLGLNRVEARCDMENTASARVLQKLGMSFEGVLRQQCRLKGEFRDIRMYSILRDEYGQREAPSAGKTGG